MQKWYEWLEEMKKNDEKGKMEEMHQQNVAQMIESAEGSAGLLHKISKSTAEAQILVNEEEDAKLLNRKGKNGQSIGSVMVRCRMWRKSLGRMRSCENWRKHCQG